MADKLTQQIIDALSKAAAEPTGLPLFAAKAEPGLFPPTSSAKPAAQKCLTDGLLRPVAGTPGAKAIRDRYTITDHGWDYLLTAVNPKQVLEDFVRVLEGREGKVGELIASVQEMAANLHGLKEAVARVIPRVTMMRFREPTSPAPSIASRVEQLDSTSPLTHLEAMPSRIGTALQEQPSVVVMAPAVDPAAELAAAILTRLADWSASAISGEDCPLPTLFRSLGTREPAPTIGEFHDCLRTLSASGSLYLHPWTGPLYALPEPAYALLAGHNIAYYASAR